MAGLQGTDAAAGPGRGKSYDLAVFSKTRPFLFEAKSWSYYSPTEIGAALANDAQKLRGFPGTMYLENPSKHILLFGYDSRGDKHKDDLCAKARLRFSGKAMFTASTLERDDDHFIVAVFEVLP